MTVGHECHVSQICYKSRVVYFSSVEFFKCLWCQAKVGFGCQVSGVSKQMT